MFTDRRLDRAFANAPVIKIDDTDKFIIFSDCHRGDNSISDEFAHNQNMMLHALDYYWQRGYTFIENGDGEELWEHARFKHIRFAHADIYELIQKFHQEKRYYMIYGNHNMQFRDVGVVRDKLFEYVDEFTCEKVELLKGIVVHESLILEYNPTGQQIHIVHGHQGDVPNDQLWQLSKFWMRYFWR